MSKCVEYFQIFLKAEETNRIQIEKREGLEANHHPRFCLSILAKAKGITAVSTEKSKQNGQTYE